MTALLSTKHAFITGASSALGSTIAKQLADLGCRLTLTGRNKEKLQAMGHPFVAADLLKQDDMAKLCLVLEKNPPDIIIHAAGGPLGFREAHTPTKNWHSVFELNLFSLIHLNTQLTPYMGAKQWGRIVHISSSSALHGKTSAPYGAAKAALNHYIKTAGRELIPKGISIAGIMPAAIESPYNRWGQVKETQPDIYNKVKSEQYLGRFQTPEEITQAVLFLCMQEGLAFSGCVLNADGNVG